MDKVKELRHISNEIEEVNIAVVPLYLIIITKMLSLQK